MDNRFSDVTTPVNHQDQATATEEGTLLGPFPEPELNITRAVRLSWPGYDDGYILESSPSANGPWTPVNATLSAEQGSLVAFVLSEKENRFFRLRKP